MDFCLSAVNFWIVSMKVVSPSSSGWSSIISIVNLSIPGYAYLKAQRSLCLRFSLPGLGDCFSVIFLPRVPGIFLVEESIAPMRKSRILYSFKATTRVCQATSVCWTIKEPIYWKKNFTGSFGLISSMKSKVVQWIRHSFNSASNSPLIVIAVVLSVSIAWKMISTFYWGPWRVKLVGNGR